jgi:transglutaminase-like putative cysteine protease
MPKCRLRIRHETTYAWEAPASWGLQQLRLRPKEHALTRVLAWDLRLEGARLELCYEDQHRNAVELISLIPGARRLTILCEGEVEVTDRAGVLGPHGGQAPLWLYLRPTARTRAGPHCRRLLAALPAGLAPLERLHALSGAVAEAIRWESGASHAAATAEEALAEGRGVCQDQAHAFIAAARALGVPARYVSGHLMSDAAPQQAMHAWAEAWVEGLGWVGFDVANRISPDARHLRVATGLDYAEAAPVWGLTRGAGGERLAVSVEVAEAAQ